MKNKNVIQVRQATSDDAYSIAKVHVLSWLSAYKEIVPKDYLENLSIEEKSKKLKNYIENSQKVTFYIAVMNQNVIGFLAMREEFYEDEIAHVEIEGIYFLEEYWGNGYGKELLNYAFSSIVARQIPIVTLWVLEENQRARNFFSNCGLTFSGEVKICTIGRDLKLLKYLKMLTV